MHPLPYKPLTRGDGIRQQVLIDYVEVHARYQPPKNETR